MTDEELWLKHSEVMKENEALQQSIAELKKENEELKQLLEEAESTSKGEDYYNRLSKYIKD